MKAALVGAIAGFLGGVVATSIPRLTPPTVHEEVRAERFVVIGPLGNEVAELAQSDLSGSRLVMYGLGKKKILELSTSGTFSGDDGIPQSALTIFDDSGESIATLKVDSSGSRLEFESENESVKLRLNRDYFIESFEGEKTQIGATAGTSLWLRSTHHSTVTIQDERGSLLATGKGFGRTAND